MRYQALCTVVAAMVVLGCGLLGGALPIRACTLDQQPSISADGHLATINTQAPRTQAQLANWNYFVFTQPYAVRRAVVLTEDRREVARTLMPSALLRPWGWLFGDGQKATGWIVRHTYARPGKYRIGVYAYNPESGQWNLFDQAMIQIRT